MLTYADESPVELLVNGAALQQKIALLKASIANWRGDSADDGFDTKVSQCFDIIGYMENKPRLPGCIYEFNGSPIGAAQIDLSKDWKIENIVTHPAYYGCGSTLIEYIVRLSILNGGSGSVWLYAASADAGAAYLRMGFRYKQGGNAPARYGDMILNPKTSAMWDSVTYDSESQGEITNYELSKHVGKTYAVSLDNGG